MRCSPKPEPPPQQRTVVYTACMICSAQTPRSVQLEALFPQGVPGLWCKLLTHCLPDGQVDWARMQAQLAFMRPHIQGFVLLDDDTVSLKLDAAERQKLIDWAMQSLRPRREFLMVATTASQAMRDADLFRSEEASCFTGLLVRPELPEQASQQELIDALTPVLRLNLPIALQQSDGTTSSLYAGQSVATLATRHENLLYFADASGEDAIARSGLLPAGLFKLRSAEGNYAQALASSGGLYHGLMLASANVFPEQLAQVVLAPALGKWDESRAISARITQVIDSTRFLAQSLPRAIRAIDHFMAFGPDAMKAAAPIVPNGNPLRHELLQAVESILTKEQLMPEKGYLS